MRGPRGMGMLRQRPRAWQRLEAAQQSVLSDNAWVQREEHLGGSIDGRPIFKTLVFGGPLGYSAKLSTPTQQERREADRWNVETTHTLALASDVVPLMSDQMLVLAPAMLNTNKQVLFQVLEVLTRRAAFGRMLIHHLQLRYLREI